MHIKNLLNKELPLISQLIDKILIEEIETWFLEWKKKETTNNFKDQHENEVFIIFLLYQVTTLTQQLEKIKGSYTAFRKNFSKVSYDKEKENIVIEWAVQVNGFENDLYGVQEAIQRWMYDDAVDERFEKVLARVKKVLIFIIQRIGIIFKHQCLALNAQDSFILWQRINMMESLRPILNITTDKEILRAVLKALSEVFYSLGSEVRKKQLLKIQNENFIYRLSLEKQQDIWVQADALSLLFYLSMDSFIEASKIRFEQYQDGDDMFVRNRILTILAKSNMLKHGHDELFQIIQIASTDRSAFVRQGVFKTLRYIDTDKSLALLTHMLFVENEDAVKVIGLDSLNDKQLVHHHQYKDGLKVA